MKVRVGTHVLSLNGSSKTSPTEKSVTQALNTAIKTQLYKKSPMLLAFMFSHFIFVSLFNFLAALWISKLKLLKRNPNFVGALVDTYTYITI